MMSAASAWHAKLEVVLGEGGVPAQLRAEVWGHPMAMRGSNSISVSAEAERGAALTSRVRLVFDEQCLAPTLPPAPEDDATALACLEVFCDPRTGPRAAEHAEAFAPELARHDALLRLLRATLVLLRGEGQAWSSWTAGAH